MFIPFLPEDKEGDRQEDYDYEHWSRQNIKKTALSQLFQANFRYLRAKLRSCDRRVEVPPLQEDRYGRLPKCGQTLQRHDGMMLATQVFLFIRWKRFKKVLSSEMGPILRDTLRQKTFQEVLKMFSAFFISDGSERLCKLILLKVPVFPLNGSAMWAARQDAVPFFGHCPVPGGMDKERTHMRYDHVAKS